eukprot:gene27816-33592_t
MQAKEELQVLNKERRKLIHDIFRVKKHQEELIGRVQQDVSSYLEDHAEKYFASDNAEFKNQTFARRYDASLKAMKVELRQLEETIGINLHDMDEELDRTVSKLAQKEKEFDVLEETLRMPIKETAEYAELIQKFLNHNPSINMDKEYQRLQTRLSLHRQFEDDFLSVIHKREKQLEKEIEIMKNGGNTTGTDDKSKSTGSVGVSSGVGASGTKPRSTLLEQVALSTTKELLAKRTAYREQIDYELDSQLKSFGEDMSAIHESYMKKYKQFMSQNKGDDSFSGISMGSLEDGGKGAESGSVAGRLAGVRLGGRGVMSVVTPPPPAATSSQPAKEEKKGVKGVGGKGKGKKNDTDVQVEEEKKVEILKHFPVVPPHWKSELLEEQIKHLEKARELREKAHEQDALLVRALERKPQSNADPTPLMDLSQKLATLYTKYNTSLLEAARLSQNSVSNSGASHSNSPIPTLFGHVYVTPSKGGRTEMGSNVNGHGESGNKGESKLSSLFS